MNPQWQRAIRRLARTLSSDELRVDEAALKSHSGDKWFASHLPDVVALPRSVKSVSKILACAHEHRIPITARGAGYGYVGSCVPSHGGIALSLARLKKILEIHTD